MTSLKELLSVLTKNSDLSIYIRDLSGLFSNPLTDVDPENKLYNCPLREFAKDSKTCLRCRAEADSYNLAKPYVRECFCGMDEIIYPVIIDGKAKCVLYACAKSEEDRADVLKAFASDDMPFDNAIAVINKSAYKDEAIKVLEIISSYITLLFGSFSFAEDKEESDTHWVVANLLSHLENDYHKDINLKQLAVLYGFNEKYLGRIFKSEVGMTFHEYLNNIRLEKASELLLSTDASVVSISKKCGFNNVTYFNRLFLRRFEKTPLEFKNAKSNKFWDKHSYLL